MKKIIALFIVALGSWFWYRFGGIPFTFAWLGLCLAFGFTCLKLHFSDAIRLWGFVAAVLILLLGGAVFLARRLGEGAAFLWIVIGTVLLMMYQKKLLRRWLPLFRLADEFERIVRERSGEDGEPPPVDSEHPE